MVGTKHCCWGECKRDSRYADKWTKSHKELEESGKKVFIPIPKPSRDMAKCKRWLEDCLREFVTEKNITLNKHLYLCSSLARRKRSNSRISRSTEGKSKISPTKSSTCCKEISTKRYTSLSFPENNGVQ